jgi:hemerythrin-like domain-containing protein
MRLLEHLEKEHRLFEEMLDLLEGWLDSDREIAGSRISMVLDALRQALIQHERVERAVFETNRGSHPAAKVLKREHDDLSDLKEIMDFLIDNCSDGTLQELKPSLAQLANRLRRHFRKEEDELWPSLKARGDKNPPKGMEEELERQERKLESLLEEVK